jgi:hypothetical protein
VPRGQRDGSLGPYSLISRPEPLLFLPTSFSIVLTRLEIKSKAIPVTGCGGLWNCEMLRISYYIENRLTDGSKVVSLTHRPPSPPQKHYFSASRTHFC